MCQEIPVTSLIRRKATESHPVFTCSKPTMKKHQDLTNLVSERTT